jgi:hypothetical protein
LDTSPERNPQATLGDPANIGPGTGIGVFVRAPVAVVVIVALAT